MLHPLVQRLDPLASRADQEPLTGVDFESLPVVVAKQLANEAEHLLGSLSIMVSLPITRGEGPKSMR
jgi:hypothetical protein